MVKCYLERGDRVTVLKQGKLPKKLTENGTNLLFITDTHFSDKKPESRIDDYEKTEKNKIDAIRELAKSVSAKAILQGGDWFDRSKVSDRYISQHLEDWDYSGTQQEHRSAYDSGQIDKNEYAERMLNTIPVVGIAGNHDLTGRSLKMLESSSLAFLEKTGFMNLVSREKPYIIQLKNGDTISITGTSYDNKLSKNHKGNLSQFTPSKAYGDINIHMVHYALYDKEIDPHTPYIDLDDIFSQTNADITLTGDIHIGYGLYENSGKMASNPGAISQRNRLTDSDRMLQTTLIHISEDNEVSLHLIELKQEDPNDLFDPNYQTKKEKDELALDRVKEILKNTSEVKETNATAIINSVANEEGVDEEIRHLAVSTTENVMDSMGGNVQLDPNTDYSIKKITLHNFESYSHKEIELEKDKPTLFIGESDSGKSAIFRALYWFFENEGNTKEFIRKFPNVKDMYVELERADGSKVKRFASLGKNKEANLSKNGYLFTEVNGESHETNTKGIEEAQRWFAFNDLKLDDKSTLPINFYKQDDSGYFIHNTAPDRAKIISALFGAGYILSAGKELENQRRRLSSETNLLEAEKDSLKKELAIYKQLPTYNKTVSNSTKIFTKLKDVRENYNKVLGLSTDVKRNNLKLNKLNEYVGSVEPRLTDVQKNVHEHKNISRNISMLNKINKEYYLINKKSKALQPFLAKDRVLEIIKKKVIKYTSVAENLTDIAQLKEKLSHTNQKQELIKPLLEKQDTLLSLNKKQLILNSQQEKLNQIVKYKNKYNEVTLNITRQTEELNSLKNQISEVEKEIRKLKLNREVDNYITIGDTTIYGVQYVDTDSVGGVNKDMESYTDRLNKLNTKLTRAKTQEESYTEQQENLLKEIKELGYNPDELEDAIEKLTKEKENLEIELDKELENMEKLADKIGL